MSEEYNALQARSFKCEIDLYEARDERDIARASNVQLQDRVKELEGALRDAIADDECGVGLTSMTIKHITELLTPAKKESQQ